MHRRKHPNVQPLAGVRPLIAAVCSHVNEDLEPVGGSGRSRRRHHAKAGRLDLTRCDDLRRIREGHRPTVGCQTGRPRQEHDRCSRVFDVHIEEGEIPVDRNRGVLGQGQHVLQFLRNHEFGGVGDEGLGAFPGLELVGVLVTLFCRRGHEQQVAHGFGRARLKGHGNACLLIDGRAVNLRVIGPQRVSELHRQGQVHRHVSEVGHEGIEFHQFPTVHVHGIGQSRRPKANAADRYVHHKHGFWKDADLQDFDVREVWVRGRCHGADDFCLDVGRGGTGHDGRHGHRHRHGQVLKDVQRLKVEGRSVCAVQAHLPSFKVNGTGQVESSGRVAGVHHGNRKGSGISGLCRDWVAVGQQGPGDAHEHIVHASNVEGDALGVRDERLVGVTRLNVDHEGPGGGKTVRSGSADGCIEVGQGQGQVLVITGGSKLLDGVRARGVQSLRPGVLGREKDAGEGVVDGLHLGHRNGDGPVSGSFVLDSKRDVDRGLVSNVKVVHGRSVAFLRRGGEVAVIVVGDHANPEGTDLNVDGEHVVVRPNRGIVQFGHVVVHVELEFERVGPRGGKGVEDDVAVNAARGKRRPDSVVQHRSGRQVGEHHTLRWGLCGSLIQPGHGDGDDVVLEGLVRGQEDASLQTDKISRGCCGRVRHHNEGKILRLTSAMVNLHRPIACVRQDTRRHTNPLDVVHVVCRPTGGRGTVGEIVAQPAGSVGGNEDQVKVIDQTRRGGSRSSAPRRVRPRQRDVNARRGVEVEGVEQTVSCSEAWAIVEEGGQHGGAVHGTDGPVEVDVAPAFCTVGHVRRTDVPGTVDHQRLDEGRRWCAQSGFFADVLAHEGRGPTGDSRRLRGAAEAHVQGITVGVRAGSTRGAGRELCFLGTTGADAHARCDQVRFDAAVSQRSLSRIAPWRQTRAV